jgi:hypothetical protein
VVGSFLAGLAIIIAFVYGVGSQPATQAPRPPELGGQKVPDMVFDIRFDKQYDLFCTFYREEPTIYRNCTIVGFTGRGEESTRSGRDSGFGVFSSPSGSGPAYYERYFDHWLVLRLADGRLAYIPPAAVKYIEEASAKIK